LCPPNGEYQITFLLESPIAGESRPVIRFNIDSPISDDKRYVITVSEDSDTQWTPPGIERPTIDTEAIEVQDDGRVVFKFPAKFKVP